MGRLVQANRKYAVIQIITTRMVRKKTSNLDLHGLPQQKTRSMVGTKVKSLKQVI